MLSSFPKNSSKSMYQGQSQSHHGRFCPMFYNPFEIKRRRRTSTSQLKILEKTFRENTKPTSSARRILAQELDMTPRGVQTWFQNRRAKAKLERRKVAATTEASLQDDDNHDGITTSTMASPPQSPQRTNAPCAVIPQSFYINAGKPAPATPMSLHKREDIWDFIPIEDAESMTWSAIVTTPNSGLAEPPSWFYQQEPSRRHSCLAAMTMGQPVEHDGLSYYYNMTPSAAATSATSNDSAFGPRRQSESDVQRLNLDFSIEDLGLDYSSVSTVSDTGSPIALDYLTTTHIAHATAPESLFLMHDLF